jgi:hypothetical protein
MVLVPGGTTTLAQRQAIGALTYDAGVTVNMDYRASGSGADTLQAKTAFVGTFGYSNAIKGYNGGSNIGAGLNGMVNPNLDAGYPILFGITGGPGGHAIVCDGYGYNTSTLYHHLNLGWSGSDDAWYALPTIDTSIGTFTTVYKCIYNVFVTGSGEIISGRVTDSGGTPLSGVSITATKNGGGTYTATTNARGIYALPKIPSSSQYTIGAAKAGYAFSNQVASTGTSADSVSTSGNVWGVNFVGAPPRLLTVTAPNGGEGFEAGITAAITWTAIGTDWQPSDKVKLEYSANGGTVWSPIPGAESLAYNLGSFA